MTPAEILQTDIPDLNRLIDTDFLYQNSPCGYLSFYADGTIIKINQTLLSWLQQSNEEIVFNKKFSDIISKGGKFYYQVVVLPLLNMQGFVNEINFEIKTKDSAFPCLFNASAIKNEDAKIIAVNAIIFNITDRKKYETLLIAAKQHAEEEKKRFEFLSNSIPNIIWTALPSGKLNFLNERFFECFGYGIASLRQTSLLHLIHPLEQNVSLALWKKSLKQGATLELEARMKIASEKYEWFLIRAVPYKDIAGKISLWFGSCTNIDEQKKKQIETVKKLNDSLSEASEVISKNSETLREIAFDQSHLIRMPLSNILGIIQILDTIEIDNDTRQLISALQQSAVQLDDIIKKIVNKTYSENKQNDLIKKAEAY